VVGSLLPWLTVAAPCYSQTGVAKKASESEIRNLLDDLRNGRPLRPSPSPAAVRWHLFGWLEDLSQLTAFRLVS
jgi:hypothetical protein